MKFVEKIGERLLQSTPAKLLVVIISILEMLFFSGIMYGINTLYPIFAEKRYFSNCPDSSAAVCLEKYFGYVIIVGNMTMTLGSYLSGLLLDKFGHFVLKLVTAVCFLTGMLCYGFSDSHNWLLFVAQILLAINAESIILCSFPISSFIFKRYQNVIVSIMAGAFDSSSAIYTLIYQAYIGPIKVEFKTSCLVYGCIGFVIMVLIGVFVLIGVDWIKTREIDNQQLIKKRSYLDKIEAILETLDAYTNEKYPSMTSILKTRLFWSHVVLFTIVFFRLSYFLAQLRLQLMTRNFPADKTPSSHTTVNTLLVQINYFLFSSILISPFVGLFIEFLKMKNLKAYTHTDLTIEYTYENVVRSFTIPYFVCCYTNLVAATFITIPNNVVWIYIAYFGLIITRLFLFSLNSAFLLQVFPKRYYGQLFGIIYTIASAIVLLEFGLLKIKEGRSMDITNYLLIAISLIPLIHPIYLVFYKNTKVGILQETTSF